MKVLAFSAFSGVPILYSQKYPGTNAATISTIIDFIPFFSYPFFLLMKQFQKIIIQIFGKSIYDTKIIWICLTERMIFYIIYLNYVDYSNKNNIETYMDNQVEQFGIEALAYEELENQFQQVLINLSSDQTLDRFRIEYQKIHKALKHSHQQEKKLLGKCRELSKDIIAGAAKLQSALRLSNDDSHTISYLKAEVSKTYKYLQLSKQSEERSKQKIQKLKAQMKKLHMMMEQNDSISEGQVASVHQYTIANEELEKQKQILLASVQSNQNQLNEVKNKITGAQNHKEDLKKQYQQLLLKKDAQEQRHKDQEQNKKTKTKQLDTIKKQFDQAKASEKISKQQRREKNIRFKQIAAQLHDIEISIEKEKKIYKKLEKEQIIESRKLQEIEEINKSLQSLMEVKQKQLYSITEDLEKQRSKQQQLRKTAANLQEEIQSVNNERQELEKLKETIKSGIIQLQQQINSQKKVSSKDRSFIQKLKRDRDMYKKQLERADISNKQIYEEIIAKEKLVKERQNQIFGQKKQIEKLNKMMKNLQKERDNNSFQATSAQAKYFYSRDEVKLRDNFIAEFQKQNLETESKLKKQQALYEAVRSDRTQVSKRLADVVEQKKQYDDRYKRVIQQISQLKEQIDFKEAELVKEHGEHKKKDRKIADQQKKIEKYEKQIDEKEVKIKQYDSEIKKLYAIIKETQYQKQKLQQEYELVVSERDILGTQLIRRSAQADLLYEKIKINQSALTKGQAQYSDKLIDIQNQKEEIANLMNEIKQYKTQNSAIGNLKSETHNLSRELTQARLKVKSLSEQIENPMNIHRWRKLQATQSANYQLMTKIQSIQKRLISKTQEVKKKEEQYFLKQKQLKSLQEVLKRQPSVEEQKMIPVYEQNLQQKQRQIETMKQQIENYEQSMSEYTIQYERLSKQLQNFKKKFFFQKKRDQQARDQKKAQQDYIKVILPDKRFTGGGFNLAI